MRNVLRGTLHYLQRLGRWPIILWQVRGATWPDQWALVRSALVAPVVSLGGLMKWQDPYFICRCRRGRTRHREVRLARALRRLVARIAVAGTLDRQPAEEPAEAR
ncbi:hypothetical protein H1235_00620 [Pseudoxanthomonas sp. NC8]|nr:hypothetical protein H1235_00620 [Pseudoxanthomonas sp. NC8]